MNLFSPNISIIKFQVVRWTAFCLTELMLDLYMLLCYQFNT